MFIPPRLSFKKQWVRFQEKMSLEFLLYVFRNWKLMTSWRSREGCMELHFRYRKNTGNAYITKELKRFAFLFGPSCITKFAPLLFLHMGSTWFCMKICKKLSHFFESASQISDIYVFLLKETSGMISSSVLIKPQNFHELLKGELVIFLELCSSFFQL